MYRGEVSIASGQVPAQHLAILANDAQADGVIIEAATDAKALLIAGPATEQNRSRNTARS